MSKIKYCYEFTEYRQYKCCECGRTMHEPTPHLCNGQYRKHKLNFTKVDMHEKPQKLFYVLPTYADVKDNERLRDDQN